MENESSLFIEKYLQGMEIRYEGTGNGAFEFQDFCQYPLTYYEAPDMYIKHGSKNAVLIMEHFRFDSSHTTKRKGSKYQSELSQIEQSMQSLVPVGGTPVSKSVQVQTSKSYSDYVRNVTENFKKHYAKISLYRQNLEKLGLIDSATDVKVMFCIEDVTIFGNAVEGDDQNPLFPVLLAYCPEFLDLLECSPKVDYVLSGSESFYMNTGKHIFFIDRHEIQEYKKKSIDYKAKHFYDSKPRTIGVKMLVDESQLLQQGDNNGSS